MNSLKGNIINIKSQTHLSLVQVQHQQHTLQVLLIETPQTAQYLKTGQSVNLLFEETEVSISKSLLMNEISIINQLPCTLQHIEQGQLLSKLSLFFCTTAIQALLPTQALSQLQLKTGQTVYALVKPTKIMFAS